ncbi:MAG: hypothetical protein K4H23_05350 [Mollicutes bacterium PWAP]|nr:hypothetical protein [Mollicutes bacterium PWAP]
MKKNYKTQYEFDGTSSNSDVNDKIVIVSLDDMPNEWSKVVVNWKINFKTWDDHILSGESTLGKGNVRERLITGKTISDTSGLAQQKYYVTSDDLLVKSFLGLELVFNQTSNLASNSEFIYIDIDYKFS